MNIFRTYPLLSRIFVFLFAPIASVVLYVHYSLIETLPQTAGHARVVSGLSGAVTIDRDVHGVVTIHAQTDNDAYFAVGYAHAQDRLWQLELQRRIAQGRLSELLGRESVRQDVWFRTLGLWNSAESSWRSLSPDAQASLISYAAGINAWIETHPNLPIEFQLLRAKPEPWTVYDSLASIKMLALSLGGNFQSEITRVLATRSLSSDKLGLFFPLYPSSGPITTGEQDARVVDTLKSLLRFQGDLESQLSVGGRFVGSNAWVISGRFTATGLPILANDPHLGLQIPSPWYALRIRAKTLNVSGMSLVGLPLVVLGRNNSIAWGATNMMADVQDLYFEQVDTANPTNYRIGGEWRRFTERTEVIKIRSDFPGFLHKPPRPVTVRVRSTVHGPIISDSFDVLPQPVALRWVALDTDDTSYEALFRLGYAKEWSTFQRALSKLVAPALNMLYADAQGNIGFLGMGRIPIRENGNGLTPVPGWDASFDWCGHIPPAEMPRSFNPADGYIVSANNRNVGANYKYFISHEWAPPARALRILQLIHGRLSARAKITVDDVTRMQTDVVDLQARELLPDLLATRPRNERQAKALRQLSKWDGEMSMHGPQPAIFHAWTRHLRLDLFADDLSLDWNERGHTGWIEGLIQSVDSAQLHEALNSRSVDWCSNSQNGRKTSCEDTLHRSLDGALRELEKLTGRDDVAKWAWSKVHHSLYEHKLFGESKVLADLFNRRIEVGGSSSSINVATADFNENDGYVQHLGASFRQIIEVGQRGRGAHRYMNSTGQSGNFVDAHYDDMITPLRNGAYFHFEGADSERRSELRLEPQAQ